MVFYFLPNLTGYQNYPRVVITNSVSLDFPAWSQGDRVKGKRSSKNQASPTPHHCWRSAVLVLREGGPQKESKCTWLTFHHRAGFSNLQLMLSILGSQERGGSERLPKGSCNKMPCALSSAACPWTRGSWHHQCGKGRAGTSHSSWSPWALWLPTGVWTPVLHLWNLMASIL